MENLLTQASSLFFLGGTWGGRLLQVTMLEWAEMSQYLYVNKIHLHVPPNINLISVLFIYIE